MTDLDVTTVAAFVRQRRELGDAEWYLGPAARAVLDRLTATGYAPGGDPVEATDKPHVLTEPDVSSHAEDPRGAGVPDYSDIPNYSDVPDNSGVPDTSGVPACTGPGDFNLAAIPTDSLDVLRETVCGCLRCPLGSRRKKFVFGEGDPRAGIMFIGEAPGADEDAQGRPFVGRAGGLLTDMIVAMKLRRDEVYIGNILKCRPPNNRDPQKDEIEACEPILLRQIELIRPKIICALGRISGQTLLRKPVPLGALRGVVHDYHGVQLVVTYHPAALLRNLHWKKPAWEDLKMVRRLYDGLEL